MILNTYENNFWKSKKFQVFLIFILTVVELIDIFIILEKNFILFRFYKNIFIRDSLRSRYLW